MDSLQSKPLATVALFTLLTAGSYFGYQHYVLNRDIATPTQQLVLPLNYTEIFTAIFNTQTSRLRVDLSELVDLSSLAQKQDHYDPEIKFYSLYLLGYQDLKHEKHQQAYEKFIVAEQLMLEMQFSLPIEIKAQFYFDFGEATYYVLGIEAEKENFKKLDRLFEAHPKPRRFIDYYMARDFLISHSGNDPQEAIDFWSQLLEKAKNIDYPNLSEIYYSLGSSYWYDNQQVHAINNKLKALEESIKVKDLDSTVYLLSDIGIDYLYTKNYGEAEYQFNQALDFHKEMKTPHAFHLYYIYSKLFRLYLETERIDEAKLALAKAQAELDMFDDKIMQENYQSNMFLLESLLLLAQGEPKKALVLNNEVFRRYQNGQARQIYHFDLEIEKQYGNIYYQLGDYQKALDYHLKTFEMVKHRNLFYLTGEMTKLIYQDYMAVKNHTSALTYLSEEKDYYLQLQKDNSVQYSQYLHGEFTSKQKQEKIDTLESQSHYLRILISISFAVLLLSLMFFFILKRKTDKISELNQELAKLSLTDGLTHVANRRAFDEQLNQWTPQSIQAAQTAIFMIDIDYFKKYNDHYGHGAGDDVIKAVAHAIQSQCRRDDLVARYGGEEFVIILNRCPAEVATRTAERIQQAIKQLQIPHEKSEVAEIVTISIGLLTYESLLADNGYQLVELADQALYQAKHQGRNQYFHQHLSHTSVPA